MQLEIQILAFMRPSKWQCWCDMEKTLVHFFHVVVVWKLCRTQSFLYVCFISIFDHTISNANELWNSDLCCENMLFWHGMMPEPEASCKSQIRTAAAIAEDVGVATSSRIGIQQWATCNVTNSERDVQRVVKKQGTKLKIPVDIMSCDGTSVPWISPESWLAFIVQNGLWPVLAGCAVHDYEGAQRKWTAFWKYYEQICPEFQLFRLGEAGEAGGADTVDYSRCAAFFIHGDEGRTLKRGGMLVTSIQSVLGRGFDEKRVKKDLREEPLRVNFAGHSFTTRFIISTIPKTAYDAQPELFHSAMEHTVTSCRKLFDDGFIDPTRNGEHFRVVFIGVKGDAPYQAKVGHLYRSFNTQVKRGEERLEPKGCCPMCLAGTNLCHYEEIATSTPSWTRTVAVKVPWVRVPSVVKWLHHDSSDPASIFKFDIWHIFHLGFGRSWVSSVIQLVLQQLPLPNLDLKWDWLTDHYKTWCSKNKKQCHISRVTAYLMSYHDNAGAMGNWRKGALTSNFCLWLVDLLGDVQRDQDNLLMDCRAATYRVNSMFSMLYKSDVFLNASQCNFAAEQGLKFLQSYYTLATKMYAAAKPFLFPLYPKLHYFHHLMLDLKTQGETCGLGVNPTLYSCQLDEDVVGRASRLSRRVNIRVVAQRTLDRYLTSVCTAMRDAGLLV